VGKLKDGNTHSKKESYQRRFLREEIVEERVAELEGEPQHKTEKDSKRGVSGLPNPLRKTAVERGKKKKSQKKQNLRSVRRIFQIITNRG